ncbi:MAG: DUF488 family protein [Thermoplasmata archaeon]|nr:DUF488 family protein [Thermoplasmata archaeon]
MIKLKRIYEEAEASDGRRYLVERLWPRGVTKEEARLDDWLKDLAPSPELRRWYGHDLPRWDKFRLRYEGELALPEKAEALSKLSREAREGPVTLVFATRDSSHSSARVLKEYVEKSHVG